ncbi:MAG TPA: hypothetical protein VHN18_17470 [Micromonosporaceae bacterium]|nr:hypothetical protein [Micromonosporaceae bacterium]
MSYRGSVDGFAELREGRGWGWGFAVVDAGVGCADVGSGVGLAEALGSGSMALDPAAVGARACSLVTALGASGELPGMSATTAEQPSRARPPASIPILAPVDRRPHHDCSSRRR